MTDHIRRITHWPDGTPKSYNNDFTGHLDGKASCMCDADVHEEWVATGRGKPKGKRGPKKLSAAARLRMKQAAFSDLNKAWAAP